jgi:hypothetical protein
MRSTRRLFLIGLGGTAVGGLAGCTSGEEKKESNLEDLLGEIEYDQRGRVSDFNQRVEGRVFAENSHVLTTEPDDVLSSSGLIDYHTSLETTQDRNLAEMSSAQEGTVGDAPSATMLGSLVVQNIWVPVRNANGGGTGHKEAGQEFQERMGDISAAVADHAGNAAELVVPKATAERFWTRIAETYNEEYKENEADYMRDLSAELHEWAEKQVVYSWKRPEGTVVESGRDTPR